MKRKKNHPFGSLLKRYLQRGNELTQNDLADAIDVDAGVISRMCRGERLTDRGRILEIIRWFGRQGIIDCEAEATALLEAAGHARLNAFQSDEDELGIELEKKNAVKPVIFRSSSIKADVEPGILNFHGEGLSTITGFDLWFSSFAQKRWQIWRLDTGTGNAQPINFVMPRGLTSQDLFVPAISTIDAKIVFAMNSTADLDHYNRHLYLADLTGENVRMLTHLPLDTYHPSWSPDGKRVAYHVEYGSFIKDEANQHGIWVTNIESGESWQLTNRMDYDPVWSPNGRYIAYHSMEPTWCIKILDYSASLHFASYATVLNPQNVLGWTAVELGHKATSVGWVNNYEIVFASNLGGKWDLYKIPVSPNKTFMNPERLTSNGWNNVYPAVFDSKILLWQAFPHEKEGDEGAGTAKIAELFVLDLQIGKEIPLITGIGNVRDGFLVRRTPAYLSLAAKLRLL